MLIINILIVIIVIIIYFYILIVLLNKYIVGTKEYSCLPKSAYFFDRTINIIVITNII